MMNTVSKIRSVAHLPNVKHILASVVLSSVVREQTNDTGKLT